MKKSSLILYICFLSFFCISWNWKDLSLQLDTPPEFKVEVDWVADTVKKKALRPNLVNNSSPLVYGKFVVQGKCCRWS